MPKSASSRFTLTHPDLRRAKRQNSGTKASPSGKQKSDPGRMDTIFGENAKVGFCDGTLDTSSMEAHDKFVSFQGGSAPFVDLPGGELSLEVDIYGHRDYRSGSRCRFILLSAMRPAPGSVIRADNGATMLVEPKRGSETYIFKAFDPLRRVELFVVATLLVALSPKV